MNKQKQRLVLCNPRLVLADVKANAEAIAQIARAHGDSVVITPRMSLVGASAGAIALLPDIVSQCGEALVALAEITKQSNCSLIVGLPMELDGRVCECTALLQSGKLTAKPYGEPIKADGMIIASPSFQLASRTELLIVTDARLDLIDDDDLLHQLCQISNNCTVAYVSSGKGESVGEGVYCGLKCVFDGGRIVAKAGFDEQTLSFDGKGNCAALPQKLQTHPSLPFVPKSAEDLDRILTILQRGLSARVEHIRANVVLLGLSGGLDSTIALLVACRAVGAQRVIAVTMNSDISSAKTKSNARMLIQSVGCGHIDVPIGRAVRAHLEDISHDTDDVVVENAQARERAQILLDLGNKHNGLVLGTGDLSEIALGFSTYGGDQLAHYNPNAALPKTLIRALVGHIASTSDSKLAQVLNSILDTPISPELKANQLTEEIVGKYSITDFYLYHLIFKAQPCAKVLALAQQNFDEPRERLLKQMKDFVKRLVANRFKHLSSCDGIRIFRHDLKSLTVSDCTSHTLLQAIARLY